ncbi:P-loop containing nucleoside triphosphate hydrolase protein [Mycena vulgaris]|nr:P-loop containing nucleoside triphosphate hydrolase protein [Mycena vulgaris]
MPPPTQNTPSVVQTRLNTITSCLIPAVATLNAVSDAFGTPFIPAISSTVLSLTTTMQTVKRNHEECTQLLEHINKVIYVIIDLHKSGPSGELPLENLRHIGLFTETLHKIHVFVEAQQDGNKFKQFFRKSEMSQLLKECKTGLQQAYDLFKIDNGATVLLNIQDTQKAAMKQQKELLELIATLSDGTSSDRGSSLNTGLDSLRNSSNSFSLLPAKPKIFHGRDRDLQEILKILSQKSAARIAILGAGGMGKTSLAKAVIHHPEITATFEHLFFIACDAASTSVEITALIGAHLGLKPGKDLTQKVVQSFAKQPPCLLVLDNLDTAWEPIDSRRKVEELLSLLSNLPHLALMITMRGTERPAKVRWTRPFLRPLQPLSQEAAYQTFMDIADDFHDPKEINKVLLLTDNMPLAVDLIAHLVDYEGCGNILARWEREKTTMLSKGYDRRSSLEASIELSLSSPRMMSLDGAKELLCLLSTLPDGLSEIELLECRISDILACKAALLRTALAYEDDKRRLKALVPIREYMQHIHPPPHSLTKALREYFHNLLEFEHKYRGHLSAVKSVTLITSNLANIQNILMSALQPDNPDLKAVIECVLALDGFSRVIGSGRIPQIDMISKLLPPSMILDWRRSLSWEFSTRGPSMPFPIQKL